VYDFEAPAARPLMLKKNETTWHANVAANAGLLSALLPPSPGGPGRWQLQDDASGLQSTAQVYRTAQLLNTLQVRAFYGDSDGCANETTTLRLIIPGSCIMFTI
jgi:hypothetical protein